MLENDVLNQEPQIEVKGFFDDDNDFSDFVDDTPTSENEEPTTAEEDVAEEVDAESTNDAPAAPTTQTLKVKFNGEEKEITLEEAVTLSQKGMNYDKAVTERDSLRNSMQILKDLAAESNMEVSELLVSLQDARDNQLRQSIVSDLRKKYPDAEEELLNRLAENEYKQKSTERKNALAENAKKEAESARKKQINAFIEKYPSLDPQQVITADIMAEVKNGSTLIEAYQNKLIADKDAEIAELKKQLQTQKQNEKNKKGTIGSLQGVGKDKGDPFLDEFFRD